MQASWNTKMETWKLKFSHILKYRILGYVQLKDKLLYLIWVQMLLAAKIGIVNLYLFLLIHLAWEKLWEHLWKQALFYSVKERIKGYDTEFTFRASFNYP